MIKRVSWLIVLVIALSGVLPGQAPAAKGAGNESSGVPLTLNAVSSSRPLANGIEVRCGEAMLQVLALRNDVLRIRIARHGDLPEDASWAVLPSAREQRATVTPEDSSEATGFRTSLLRVRIDRKSMRMLVADLNGNVLQEEAAGWPVEFHGNSFRLSMIMPDDEHYFGLGDKVGPLDRRNEAFTLWNTDAYRFQESTDPIYKSIPFFITFREGRSTGVLLDNTWRSSFDFGKRTTGVYSFGAENGPIDYYILYGPEPKHVLESYAWLTGFSPLPPLWSLGYQQSRYSYGTQSELKGIADRLRADRIPADALYLDIDYQKDNRPFTVDPVKFPHFTQMLADLKKQNFHVVAITDLHIAYLPNAGYAPYDSGIAGDHFVKNPDGSLFIGRVWPGPSVFPDFTQQSTRAWWGTLYAKFVSDGIAGFWNDMNEPSVFSTPNKTMPDDVQHRIDEPGFRNRVATHREIHNVYGMENSRATYEGLLKLSPDQRPFVLTRATYAGGQRYAVTWTGDNSSTWNHVRLTTPMLLNLGLSGFGLAGADVGGFAGSPPADLLTKWIELASFQPIDRDHTEKGSAPQEPWVDGPGQEEIRRRYIEERYRLMPYLYTTVEEMSRTGLPVVRPLFLEFPNAAADGRPLDIEAPNEFLFGPDLLVTPAPFPEEPDSYAVTFPPGGWYNYWTGERITGDKVEVHPALPTLPVYVREGAIVPMEPLTQSTVERPQGPLILRVYPGRNCQGSVYQDDGISMAYRRGNFLRMQFSCEQTANAIELRIGPHQGTYPPWWNQLRVEVYGWNFQNAQVLLNGKPESRSAIVDSAHHMVAVTIPEADGGRNWKSGRSLDLG